MNPPCTGNSPAKENRTKARTSCVKPCLRTTTPGFKLVREDGYMSNNIRHLFIYLFII